jgi:8-amino-7-oxononanoate synthase
MQMIDDILDKRAKRDLLRTLYVSQNKIDFASNDYFGFSNQKVYERSGSSGSRLLTGNSSFCEELEEKLACYHLGEKALIFNSGYTANLGLISALTYIAKSFICDEEIHASTRDGLILSKKPFQFFQHNDLEHLEGLLQKSESPCFVIVESIYSISGDFAPLKEIEKLCDRYGAHLIVDEAHATGLYGNKGEGLATQLNAFARVYTFSKAMGCLGACVVGSANLKRYLLNYARPLIYSTALPLCNLKAIERSYNRLEIEASIHQKRIRELIHYFNSKSPIHFIKTKPRASDRIDIRYMRFPTVKKGGEGVRVVLHSFNTKEQIDELKELIQCEN